MTEKYLLYLRKSRADGENETVAQVLAKHESIMQEYAMHEFGELIPESNIYREVVSGETISDRPEVQRVLSRIEDESILGVLIVEPQRMSRGDLVDCGTIINAFRYTNTSIHTPMMVYDMNNKMERKFFEQELMRGNDYLEYTKEILLRGRIASVKKGHFIGSIAPYGWQKFAYKDDSNKMVHTLKPHPEEAGGLMAMYDAYGNKGFGYSKTAQYLDSLGYKPRNKEYWSPAAIKDILANPTNIGKIRWNWRKVIRVLSDGELNKSRPKSSSEDWILVDGIHDGIIDEELYNKVQERIGNNPRVPKSATLTNCFSGLLFCSCGYAMTRRQHKRSDGTMKCAPRLLCNHQKICGTKSCTYDEMIESVSQILQKHLADFKLELSSEPHPSYNLEILSGLKQELSRLQQIDDEQHDLLEQKIYTREKFIERNKKLQDQMRKIRESISNLENNIINTPDFEERIATFEACLTALNDFDTPAEVQNELLKKCIKRITYTRQCKSRTRWDTTPFELDVELIL